MSKEEILNKIAKLKEEKSKAAGTPCEVYSRVVGYLRPVQSWNKGKKQEYEMRKHFKVCCHND